MGSKLAVIADDLSGAVEAGAGLLLRTPSVIVTLGPASPQQIDTLDHVVVVVVDTDTRSGDAQAAASALTAALARFGDSAVVVKKVDSLLRGHVAAELSALQTWRSRLVVAPSLPAAGRVVRDGVLFIDGTPLHESDAWRAEGVAPPRSVAAALDPLPTVDVHLSNVRGPRLAEILTEVTGRSEVPLCDAIDDADLDRIAVAAAGLDHCTLAGSAALVAAVGRAVLPAVTAGAQRADVASRRGTTDVVVAVGSAAPSIAGQLDKLAASGATIVLFDPCLLDAVHSGRGSPTEPAPAVRRPDVTVVAVDPRAAVDGAGNPGVAAAVADRAVAAAGPGVGLVLTGGQTARAVLDRLGVTSLRPLGQVHHGAVVSVAGDGRIVGIRPGSFGGPDSLVALVDAVANPPWPAATVYEETP